MGSFWTLDFDHTLGYRRGTRLQLDVTFFLVLRGAGKNLSHACFANAARNAHSKVIGGMLEFLLLFCSNLRSNSFNFCQLPELGNFVVFAIDEALFEKKIFLRGVMLDFLL